MTPIIHILTYEPSNSLGNDGDIAVYNRFLYFKNHGEWMKASNDILKHDNSSEGELAIWHGNLRIKGNKNLKFNENIGLTLGKINEASSDTDKFLVSDNGVLKYRTGAQLLSDIGADTHTDASTTEKGVVELATTAETTTGTDATRAVTPDGLKDGFEGSANIDTVGTLNSGRITSGFGDIDVGDGTIVTTGAVSSGPATSTKSTITGATLTASANDNTDNLVDITQTLNAGSGENSGMAVETYSMLKGTITDTDSAGWDNVYHINMVTGGASKFTTDKSGNVVAAGTVTSSEGACTGPQIWTKSLGGYKTNNNSSTLYYFQYYPNYYLWANADSSPTSINSTDVYSAAYFPKASGTLTNIDVVCRGVDTGTTDPLKFYVFKGTPANNATATSLTQIGVTDTITPIALKQMKTSTDISSSNTFSATDRLWVMYKKDSTSGNQDLFFEVTISGVYS